MEMTAEAEDISSLTLKHFIIEQQGLLQTDKRCLQEKEDLKLQHSVSSHDKNFHFCNLAKNEAFSTDATVPCKNHTQNRGMLREDSVDYVLSSPREQEQEQLINLLSVPKTKYLYPKSMNKEKYPFKENHTSFTSDDREREKDRLAAIFARSGNTFLEKSNYEVSKNLNSDKFCEKRQLLPFSETKTKCSKENSLPTKVAEDHGNNKKATNLIIAPAEKTANNHMCNNPTYLVSEYLDEPRKRNSNFNTVVNNNMVRIGEFSPHNPNLLAGKPILGIGEYEERRKKMLDQQKQEYNEYLYQASEQSRSHSPFQGNSDYSNQLRSVATQTDWEHETTFIHDSKRNSTHCASSLLQVEDQNCQFSSRNSPIPKCLEGLSEKEIKEYLYREELRKQIEEKNRLKEEQRKREEEEEAKLEAKIQKDQEEMRKQFEAERIQRLELAIRKKEQEDLLRQRLAAEQQKALQENKAKRKQLLKEKSILSNSQLFMKSSKPECTTLPLNKSMPTTFASKTLSDVHEVLKQPLLDAVGLEPNQQSPLKVKVPSKKTSALDQALEKNTLSTTSPPIHSVNKVDILTQKGGIDPTMQKNVSQQTQNESPPFLSHSVNGKMEEVDKLLKVPLLPENHQILPPMSPPLLHATIPPVTSSFYPLISPPSPPVPASTRIPKTNHDLLEDRWKVPYVERYNVAPANVFTKHNHSVLTQLGAFRRQLQQERLRMQQRLQDESP